MASNGDINNPLANIEIVGEGFRRSLVGRFIKLRVKGSGRESSAILNGGYFKARSPLSRPSVMAGLQTIFRENCRSRLQGHDAEL